MYDSQLPAGMESVRKIQEMESQWNRAPEQPADEEKVPEAPQFVLKPEPCSVKEGDWARFCCRLTGHPRPRVMWLINGHSIVNVRAGTGSSEREAGSLVVCRPVALCSSEMLAVSYMACQSSLV